MLFGGFGVHFGFVAADEAGAGIDDGFEEICFCSNSADGGEIGTELTALVALLVAERAGCLLAVEDVASARDVAFGKG